MESNQGHAYNYSSVYADFRIIQKLHTIDEHTSSCNQGHAYNYSSVCACEVVVWNFWIILESN